MHRPIPLDMDASALDPELERLLDHSDWLRALARKLVGDAATADDLVQETWLAAMKSPPDPARPVRPWLAGVVRRLARMRARGEGRRSRRQTAAAREDALPSTAELVENIDTQRRLGAVVMNLSEPYRTTVMLRYFEGMSSADIARRQGVPSGTVRWRLKRGLDELRERLDEDYSSRGAWCLAFLAMERTHLAIVGTSAATTVGAGTLAAWAGAAALMAAVGAGIYTLRGQDVFASSSELLEGVQPPLTNGRVGKTITKPTLAQGRMASAGYARLRLVEEGNFPTEGLKAVLVLPDGQSFDAKADEEGMLVFPTPAEAGTLFVAREASFLHIEELTFEGVEQEVRLPAGASLVGRVVDTGGAPVADLALKLDSDRLIWKGKQFPVGVDRALGSPRLIRTTTTPDGYFHFRGLSADWSGELGLPPSVSLVGRNRREEQGGAMHVEGPRTDLVIEVERLPMVTGVVAQAGSEPVSGAEVRVWLDSLDKPLSGITDDEGRFGIQLDDRAPGGLRVEAENTREGGLGSLELALEELEGLADSGDLDLGTIYLVQGLRQEFLAVDQSGLPIRGAVATQEGTQIVSSPSGGDGRGQLELSADGEHVIVIDAPGYLSWSYAGFGLAEAVLEPASELTLRVLDGDGAPLPGLMIEVHAENRLFAEGDPYAPSELDQVTMAGRTGEVQAGEELGRFFLSEDGDLQLAGVASGIPMQVRVFDNLGRLVGTRDVPALVTSDVRTLDLTVAEPLRTFDAVVQDSTGQTLVGALVEIAAEESHQSQTQDDGIARFDQLGTDRVMVTVSMRGFATLVETDYVLPTPGQSATFTLDPGHDVEVQVIDVLGQPVTGGSIHAAVSSNVSVRGLPLLGSEQVLEDLSAGDKVIELQLGGLTYEQTINPADGRLVFTVPVQGELAVNWSLPEVDDEAAYRIVAQPVPVELEALAGQDQGEAAEQTEPQAVTVPEDEGSPAPESEEPSETGEGGEAEQPSAGIPAGEEAEHSPEEAPPEFVDEREQVVHSVSVAAGLSGTTDLVLAPGRWIVALERSALPPAEGAWEAIGEPMVLQVNQETAGQVQLGLLDE